MRVTIANDGQDAAPLVRITVDNYGVAVDCTDVAGTLVDPTIRLVEWAPAATPTVTGSTISGSIVGSEIRSLGRIYRRDGSEQMFADFALLAPYLAAYDARKAEIVAAQEAFVAVDV